MKRRESFLLTGALLGSPLLAYAAAVEPNQLRLRKVTITIKDLPPAFDHFRISHITDFHYRPATDAPLIEKVTALSNSLAPDLVALTGDFVVSSLGPLPQLLSKLDSLESQYGSFACLGNHDRHKSSLGELRQLFRESQTTLLVNEQLTLPHRGSSLELIGVDSLCKGAPDLSLPYRNARSFKLMLAHEPDLFDAITTKTAAQLTLSGHTHGGQCRVPYLHYAPLTPKYGRKYVDGHFQKGDQHLFVSSGVGTSGLRIRFACKPEVVLITLRRA